MADGYHSKWDNNSQFPLLTGTHRSLLADGDIVNQKILEYFRGVIQANLVDRWIEQCNKCGLVNSKLQNMKDGYVVGDAICYPPPATLQSTDYRFPLLSVYRQGEQFLQLSTMKPINESDFLVTWTLPPLNSPEQLNAMYPFLSMVSKVISLYTFSGHDPKYNNGELVWKEAGFAWASLNNVKYGQYLGNDGKTIYPSLQIHFTVYEKTSFVTDDSEPLLGFDATIDAVDKGSVNNPIVDFITVKVDPNLSISTFSPTSANGEGNQLIQINGAGLVDIKQIQLMLADQSLITLSTNFKVKSDKTILAITSTVPASVSGKIVVTNSLGVSAVSADTFFLNVFSPMTLTPSFFIAPGDYSEETGLWTATVGPNLLNFNAVGEPALAAPPAVNGCPDMPGDAFYHELLDEAPALSGNVQDATPFDTWSSSGARTLVALCVPKDLTAYGDDPTAYYNNAVVFGDFNVYVGITLRADRTGPTPVFYCHYQDYIDDLTATATIDVTQYVDSNGYGSLFIQARKQEDGLMQIKCNDSAWIDGDTGVVTPAGTAQGPMLGQFNYKGLIKTAISYQRPITDDESDQLYLWSKKII